ncbi:KAP family P-loop NTPase fold protein [Cellulophaga baltica]|uniref:KAP family P-loop NTPase fold protein n=1 Tax=Cellulophaga baltica TaxID=76594 RepID=UPI002495047C|nr:P-loop NTPase fold protein [Cellulophaga baltica]
MKKIKSFINCFGIKLIQRFRSQFSWKRLILIILTIFCFIYFQNPINVFINKFLLTERSILDQIPVWLFIISSLGCSIRFLFIIIYRDYKASFVQFWTTLGIVVIYIYYSSNPLLRNWHYIPLIDNTNFSYFDLVFIPLLVFITASLLSYLWVNIKDCLSKNSINILFDDQPISHSKNDLFNYQFHAERLAEILLNQDFEKSFTIGIVGPWGNGKSSLIKLLDEEVKLANNEEITTLFFYPYLNHNEEEIISEFFNLLRNNLKKFDGSLSNQLLSYSEKLVQLYKKNSLKDFFENPIVSNSDASASELYDKINRALKTINRKHIIYIDDLDRLSEKEILQVLKLIRNTANFYNFHFVVALDKEYVLASLKNKASILSTKFIDKFFQLEVYLPELDNTQLSEIFIQHLEKSRLGTNSQFIVELKNIIDSNLNLFDDYIKNVRDVKRVANQVIFDYPFIGGEIDLKDFLNFTYLKLKFPKILKLLNDKRDKYLHVLNNQYRLKVIDNQTEGDEIEAIRFDEYFNEDYSESELYKFFKGNEECQDIVSSLDCEDLELVVKTLHYLFGNKNSIESFRSIKFIGNFRKLMRLRYEKDDLTHQDFFNLLNEPIFKSIEKKVSALSNEKVRNALANFGYFKPSNEIELKSSILFHSFLLENRNTFSVDETTVIKSMAKVVYAYQGIEAIFSNPDSDLSKWIKKELFEEKYFSEETKLLILGYIWDSKFDDNLWGIEEEYFRENVPKLLEDYLKNRQDTIEINDYSFYNIYFKFSKDAKLKQNLNDTFHKYLSESGLKMFCVQSTDFDGIVGELYKISDGILQFFDSKENFHEFVKTHREKESSEIKEYLKFLDLCSIVEYRYPIAFKFKNFRLMNEKFNASKENNKEMYAEKNKGLVQIIFEVFDYMDLKYLMSLNSQDNSKYRLMDFRSFLKDDKGYLVTHYYYGKESMHVIEYGKKLLESIQGKHSGATLNYLTKGIAAKELTINLEEKILIQLYSIQPI